MNGPNWLSTSWPTNQTATVERNKLSRYYWMWVKSYMAAFPCKLIVDHLLRRPVFLNQNQCSMCCRKQLHDCDCNYNSIHWYKARRSNSSFSLGCQCSLATAIRLIAISIKREKVMIVSLNGNPPKFRWVPIITHVGGYQFVWWQFNSAPPII